MWLFFDARYLKKIKEGDLRRIVLGNTEMPLFKERLGILREIGLTLVEKFDGDFRKVLDISHSDVIKLLNLILSNFPSFDDVSEYKGRNVAFYKRAQLLISDIGLIFDGEGYGKFTNLSQLTAFADYKIPQILRKEGILLYRQELAEGIDDNIQIPKGSKAEVEIRANTIWAVELIKQRLRSAYPDINSDEIDYFLWLKGNKKSPNDKPYHLTRTTAY